MPRKNPVIHLVDAIVRVTLDPLATASNRIQYGIRGYLLSGVALFITGALLWQEGSLQGPVSDSPMLKAVFEVLFDAAGLNLPVGLPLGVTVAFLYFVGFFIPPFRTRVGVAFADAVVSLLDRLLAFGEWCLRHRLISVGLFLAVGMAIAVLLTLEIERQLREEARRRDFKSWLSSAFQFVRQAGVTNRDYPLFDKMSSWQGDVAEIRDRPPSEPHPAVLLNEVLRRIYSARDDRAMGHRLAERQDELDAIMARYRKPTALVPAEQHVAWHLANVMMGRATARHFDICAPKCQLLNKAHAYFSAADDVTLPGARDNGLGTVYALAFSRLIEGDTTAYGVCADANDCLFKAFDHYARGAARSETCSFEARRWDNNVTDLLLRAGHRYQALRLNVTGARVAPALKSTSALVAGIHDKVDAMMACAPGRDLFPTIYITAAQALAVSASLRERADSAHSDLLASAHYLRLAYHFNEADAAGWDMRYFCVALRPAHRGAFVRSLNEGFHGMTIPDWPLIEQSVRRSCHGNT